MTSPKYRRVLLKISGEVLMGGSQFGIDMATVDAVAEEVKAIHATGVELCLVIGGGNIFRGLSGAAKGMERGSADYMGMLATVMNALAMQNALERIGVDTRVQSAIRMDSVCEPYIRRKAQRHLEKGRVVIFAAGTGNPYFTTDTAASLRAIEIQADVILKGTRVDGIYTADPEKDPAATRFETITFSEVYQKSLNVMDMTAITLCQENKLPIIVFDMNRQGNLLNVIMGKNVGTLVNG